MANVIAYLVAAIAALSGLAWILLGIAGWAGILRRNRYFGIRSTETMRSEKAFAAANRVVAPGLLATGVLALVAAGLAVSQRGIAGIALGLIGARAHVVVYAETNRGIRVISFRKANFREQSRYEQEARS